ncbi:hypothetical protein RvY_17191-2 [Ramazzottius varieornatus]|uniref:Uncharacterized protein n=1 Tax=Ramazzottius varieornatus TaxID=947166 RepID=A0A1D1W1Q6_RAMVA|nr:hypothetical protein RvY_17191-2 [Ramazzottius varieornatus]
MTTYEWASFFPIGPSPANASIVWNTSANANDKYVVVVKTNDKTLTMEMSEVADSDYDTVEVVVIRPHGTETFKVSDKIRYFKGIVRELNDSRAHGIFRTTGLFEGIIETDTETYFVESAIKFIGNGSIYSGSLDPTLAVIYRWQDLRQFPFETACNQKMLPCYYYQTMQHYRQLFPPEDILEARHGEELMENRLLVNVRLAKLVL